MSSENLTRDDQPGFSARRCEARGDADGSASLRRETLRFVGRHLPSETGVERRIDRAFDLVEDAMTPQARLVVEMDASAGDVQLMIRVLDGSAPSAPFGLAEEAGQIEIWIRLTGTHR